MTHSYTWLTKITNNIIEPFNILNISLNFLTNFYILRQNLEKLGQKLKLGLFFNPK